MTCHRLSCGLKSALRFAALLVTLASARADETPPGESLRQGLYAEEVKRDPEAAAKHYAEIIAAEDRRRATVATAIFRLAEVKRGQGKNDEAITLYQKLLREYPSAEAEGKLAREHLEKLGGSIPATGGMAEPDEETVAIERIKKLMKSSPDLANLGYEMGNAVLNNQAKVLRFLLESGAVPLPDLLERAAKEGKLACLNTLLEVAKDQVASQRGSALATAAAAGHVEIVKALLKAGTDINWQPEKCPKPFENWPAHKEDAVGTPLTTALWCGQQAVVELLLEAKADVRPAANPTGLTALHAALLWDPDDRLAVAEQLIALGADVNALASFGKKRGDQPQEIQSPLQAALDGGGWKVAALLVERGADLRQPGLLAPFLTNYYEPKQRAKILRFLLDAGADPGPDPYAVLTLVAPVDDDGSRTTKLLSKLPAPPDLKKLPDMSQWPEPARVALLDRAVYPGLGKLPGVKLLFADSGVWRTVWEPDKGGDMPSAIELVWENRDAVVTLSERAKASRETFRQLKCTLMRPQPDGSCMKVEEDGGPDTPPHDRDIIVIFRSDRGTVESEDKYQEFRDMVIAQLRQKVAFPVTLEIGGKAREIRLRGDRLVFDPTVAEAPLLHAAPLARLLLPTTGGRDGGLNATGTLRIQRKGWSDLTFTLGSAEAEKFPLCRGDRLILTGTETPESLARAVDGHGRINPYQTVLTTPGLPFARVLGVAEFSQDTKFEMPTLLEAITDCYAGPGWTDNKDPFAWTIVGGEPVDFVAADEQALYRHLSDQPTAVVLPAPDFSAIRIRRIGKDGKEETIKMDLAAEIARCTDATEPAEARKTDMNLQPGDIVELPLKPAGDQPWAGLSADEIRFFRKALARRVLVNRNNQISTMELAYQPPRWRKTAFGLLPLPPAEGFATFRLSAVNDLLTQRDREEQRRQMESGGFRGGGGMVGGRTLVRGGRDLSSFFNALDRDPFVRDGDTVTDARGGPGPGPAPRVVSPPAAPTTPNRRR